MTIINDYTEVLKLDSNQLADFSIEEIDQVYSTISDSLGTIFNFAVESRMFLDEGPVNLLADDLIPTELKSVQYIGDYPGCRANEMADKWDVSPAFMSRTLRRLEDLDIIYKEIDRDNRIYFNIYLTDKGIETLHMIRSCQSGLLTSMIDTLIDEHGRDQVKLFFDMCDVAADNLEDLKGESIDTTETETLGYNDYRGLRFDDFMAMSVEELEKSHHELLRITRKMERFINKYYNLMIEDDSFESGECKDIIQARLLKVISDNPGITASDIREKWDKSPAYMSRLLRELEDKGMIYREINPENRIYLKIYVTDVGESIVADLKRYEIGTTSIMLDGLLKSFEREEIEKFTDFCETSIKAIDMVYDTSACC